MLEEALHTTLFDLPWLVPVLATVGLALLGGLLLPPDRARLSRPGARRLSRHAARSRRGPVAAARAADRAGGRASALAPFPGRALRASSSPTPSSAACWRCRRRIRIWHGLTPALYMSVDRGGGRPGVLVLASAPRSALVGRGAAARGQDDLRRGWSAARVAGARRLIRPLHDGAFSRYAAIIAVTVAGGRLPCLVHRHRRPRDAHAEDADAGAGRRLGDAGRGDLRARAACTATGCCR